MQEIIYPRSLQKGDQVCLIDPANAYTEAGVDAAVSFLEGKGLQVRVADDMAFRHGTPIERAGKLNRIFQDENCGDFLYLGWIWNHVPFGLFRL